MIDLTEHVSASMLAATAAKLEAEQNERDEAEAQKNVEEAVKPYKQKLVRLMSATLSQVQACMYCAEHNEIPKHLYL